MYKSENWTTEYEITKLLGEKYGEKNASGPVLYEKNWVEYTDSSGSHISVTGASGMGKTFCVTLPFAEDILIKKENLILVETKGQCTAAFADNIPIEYQRCVINLRNPSCSYDRYNPLQLLKKYTGSDDLNDRHMFACLIDSLADNIFCSRKPKDKLVTDSAKGLFKAMIYTLIEKGEQKAINLQSVQNMLSQMTATSHYRDMAEELYFLCDSPFVKNNLNGYILSDSATRRRITDIAKAGVDRVLASPAISEILRADSCGFDKINSKTPFAVFIVMPDNCKASHIISALITDQLNILLQNMAQTYAGRLSARVNIIAEDIAYTGRGIPSLPRLAHQGQSRNIRVMYTCHSPHDTKTAFGREAKLLENSCGLVIGFSTNCDETIKRWSSICGSRVADVNGIIRHYPLADEASLRAMPAGTALVIKDGRYKFITHFRKFDRNADTEKAEHHKLEYTGDVCPVANLEDFLTVKKNETEDVFLWEKSELEQMCKKAADALAELGEEERMLLEEKMKRMQKRAAQIEKFNSDNNALLYDTENETDEYVPCGDFIETLAQQAEYRHINADKDKPHQPKYFVEISDTGNSIMEAARIVAETYNYNLMTAAKMLREMPLALRCDSKKQADMLALELSAAMCKVKVKVKR